MLYERERNVSIEPAYCHSCKELYHVFYCEGLKVYCPACAMKYGAITYDEYIQDAKDVELAKRLEEKSNNGVK